MSSDEPDPKISQFVELTGADADRAKQMLSASGGDMDAALALHFDAGGGEEEEEAGGREDAAAAAAAEAEPALPKETDRDLVASILSNARQEGGPEASGSPWGGAGRALGSSSDPPPEDAADAAGAADGAPPAMPAVGDRSNARKIRVIFWEDGFTVEDVTAEEEAAEAAAKAPAGPRRTGVATLSSEVARSASTGAMPKLPELRKYEDNAEFMRDLKQSIPPREFREIDLSTGAPRPRPVDIMLGDMRPQPYPAELVRRQNAMMAGAPPKPKPKTVSAFSGAGHTLGGASSAGSSSADLSAAPMEADDAGGAPSATWAERAAVVVDEAQPKTSVQVRAGGSAHRFALNTAHTVADLKALLEAALAAAGEAPKAYVLAAGFPPKPLTDEAMTIEAAGLSGAAVTLRWA